MNLNFPPTTVFHLLGYKRKCSYNLIFLNKIGNFSQAVSPNICDYGNTELGLFSIRKETFVMELEGRKGQF